MAARRPQQHRDGPRPASPAGTLRIIGGRLRGRPIAYLGDPRTRPMKQRVREAIFNLLGPRVKGAHVVDLFAGTGAVSWEALSRGAISATLFEQHFPTARLLEENARELGVLELIEVISGDTFFWARQEATHEIALPRDRPWLVFCCPPYELYVSQCTALLDLVRRLAEMAPAQSVIVVEADSRFDVNALPTLGPWDVRSYPPAVVAVAPVIQPTHPAS